MTAPRAILLAGPNGAGKSTAARSVLRGAMAVDEFVNADVIAQGHSGFSPESAAVAAGRIMLGRMRELAASRRDFAFETTLASRTFVPWLRRLISDGYQVHLLFLWLPSPEVALARVAERVRQGGHDVPESTVRRRYSRGIENFFHLDSPLASRRQMIDNSQRRPRLIAVGIRGNVTQVHIAPLGTTLRQPFMAPTQAEIDALNREADAIEAALQRSVAEVLLMHKRLGNPVAVCDDEGRVQWIPPEEIEVDDPSPACGADAEPAE